MVEEQQRQRHKKIVTVNASKYLLTYLLTDLLL